MFVNSKLSARKILSRAYWWLLAAILGAVAATVIIGQPPDFRITRILKAEREAVEPTAAPEPLGPIQIFMLVNSLPLVLDEFDKQSEASVLELQKLMELLEAKITEDGGRDSFLGIYFEPISDNLENIRLELDNVSRREERLKEILAAVKEKCGFIAGYAKLTDNDRREIALLVRLLLRDMVRSVDSVRASVDWLEDDLRVKIRIMSHFSKTLSDLKIDLNKLEERRVRLRQHSRQLDLYKRSLELFMPALATP